MSNETGGCPMNRRGFLRTLGMGAAASAATLAPGLAGSAGAAPAAPAAARFGAGTTFGRMFPNLRPFAAPGPALTEALLDLGRPAGVLDAGDDPPPAPWR